MKKIAYHISQEISLNEKEFVPRVPRFRTKDEEGTTKRVCVSKSIEGAIGAFPYKSEITSSVNCKKPTYLAVYEVDLNRLEHLDSKDIEELVPDAHLTEECWVLENFKIKPSIIKINKLRLERYNKYTWTHSGLVTEFEFERGCEEYGREEVHRFVGRTFRRQAIKWAEKRGIYWEVEHQERSSLRHQRYALDDVEYYCGSTKKYSIVDIKFKVPKNVDISELWVISNEQRQFLSKQNLTLNPIRVDDKENWFLALQDSY